MDEATLQFYRGNAEAYAEREITSRRARLNAFMALLPPGVRILELGCGAGGDTAEMLAQGVRATDGSPELAEVASRRLGRPVETLLFHDLDEVGAYDAVWANACLLHVPRTELADVLHHGFTRHEPDWDPDTPPGPGGTNIISRDLVPKEWNVSSKQEATVTKDGANKFDFVIP